MNIDRRYIIAGCFVAAAAFGGCGEGRTPSTINAEQGIQGTPQDNSGANSPGAAVSNVCKTLAVCSDGQALAIALAANQGEIDEATAVLDRLRDMEVRQFAQRMIADHTKLRDAIAAAAANPLVDVSGTGNQGSGNTGTGNTGNTGTDNGNTGTGNTGSGNTGAGNTGMGNNVNAIVAQPNAISLRLQQETRRSIADLQSLSGAELDRAYLEHEMLEHLTAIALFEHVVVPSITNQSFAMAVASGAPVIKMHALLTVQIQTRLEGVCGGQIRESSGGTSGGGTQTGGGTQGGGTQGGGSQGGGTQGGGSQGGGTQTGGGSQGGGTQGGGSQGGGTQTGGGSQGGGTQDTDAGQGGGGQSGT